jgi:hypothetical protein
VEGNFAARPICDGIIPNSVPLLKCLCLYELTANERDYPPLVPKGRN